MIQFWDVLCTRSHASLSVSPHLLQPYLCTWACPSMPSSCDLQARPRCLQGNGYTAQAGYPVAARSLDSRALEHSHGNGARWAECNGHNHAPDQATQGQPAPAYAVRVVLLAAEDSYAPVLAAAMPCEWRSGKFASDAAAANGGAHPSEENVSFIR